MSRLRVGLLTNPSASKGAARATAREVHQLLRAAGINVVDVSGSSASIARARTEQILDTISALIVVGGDGTVALGADVVADTGVPLGIVPAGSGNDFARALQLPVDDPVAAVRRLLESLDRNILDVDAIELHHPNRSDSGTIHVALGNVSMGFDATVNQRANSWRWGYIPAVFVELARFAPVDYWIEVDGGPRERLSASLLTLCNSGVFGGGMHLSPESQVDDGLLELVTVEGLSRRKLLTVFPRVFRGSHVDLEEFSVRSIRSITVGVEGDPGLLAFADGEERGPFPLTARVRPGAIRILAAPPKT